MKNKPFLWLTLVVGLIIVIVLFISWAGNDFQPLRSDSPPFQIRYDMHYQLKVGAQQPNTFFADRKSMRDQVPGTIPRDGSVFTDTSYQQTEASLRNPISPLTPALFERGRNRFHAFCAPCHSESGQDTTEIVRRGMQKPPNLAAPNAVGYSDQHIYYIICKGQNVMPGYADKLFPDDRWAIVSYVRHLQKAPLRNYTPPAVADSTSKTPAGK